MATDNFSVTSPGQRKKYRRRRGPPSLKSLEAYGTTAHHGMTSPEHALHRGRTPSLESMDDDMSHITFETVRERRDSHTRRRLRPTQSTRGYASMASHRSYPTQAWASDRLADVAVDDINFTTRSNVNVGQIQAIAASKIGA